MFGASREIEKLLCVGTVMMLQTDSGGPDNRRLKTVLRGWRARHHLILDYPIDEYGRAGELEEEQPCVARFLLDGWACAFTSEVINWDLYRAIPNLRLKWPQAMDRTSFRKAERVKVQIPCEVTDETGVGHPAELCDLSVGGCKILSPKIFAEGSQVRISFTTPDNFLFSDVRLLVRNLRECQGGFHLGCEIIPGQETVCNDIEFLVKTTLADKRTTSGNEKPAPVVLVIDELPEVYEQLTNALKGQTVEVVWAGNVLDGMCRLRMLSPAAVLVDSHLPDLNSVDFCRIVRGVKGFDQLPMYVFDEDGPEAGERVRQAGATGFFGQHQVCMDEIVSVTAGALHVSV